MSDELKPCPHCKNARNIKLVEYRPNCSGAVVCGQCGARGPKAKNDHKRGWKEKAIEGWNTSAERTCRRVVQVPAERGCGQPALRAVCSECGDKLGVTAAFCKRCGAKVVGR